uniref:heme attachment to plastid cytochrome c n=1 Tax=Hypnea cryptica TaxID=2546159 RepID=UPI0027D9E8FF|nr:heme attachment to plastid cytochrome c [Hypnea cryptica]WCH55886.1 heme attachment to plastid cytochrome c [Hypnea cryptica]
MSWNLIENNLINLSFAILLITLIIYWSNITINNNKILSKIGTICTIIINLSLGTSLLIRWINNRYFPLSNLYESLIFLTWALTFIHLIIEKQNNSKLIGAINIPISLFVIAFSSLVLPPEIKEASPLVPALRSNWLMMHVSIMMFSYGTLILGSLLSILFLILSITNKYKVNKTKLVYGNNKTYLLFNRLNLLQSVDNLSYRIISLGFPMLTIGIIAGSVWANEAWGSYWSWDPKETWALITWIIFATYLHARLSKSWQGEKPAILASLGFIVVWICYLGVNFLGKGLHSYGWI